jgi:hypothetical protein
MDSELERFKTEIDLRQFAAAMGYALDPVESWRASAVMRLGTDKVIIKRENDGHYVYCSVRDARDKGTIVDFLQFRTRKSLGEVRKQLRPWIDTSRTATPLPTIPGLPELTRSGKDLVAVEFAWMQAGSYGSSRFLEETRAIPRELVLSPRFAGRIRVDQRSNVLFRHGDGEDQLCGFEKKNAGFTGFSAGGEKGLGRSNDFPGDRRIVFAESFIDLLSHAALFPDDQARYRSIAGGLNPKQPDIMRADILALPVGSEVVAAMDANDAGRSFAATLERLVANLPGFTVRIHLPEDAEDWNDVQKRTLIPAARFFLQPFPTDL